MAKNYLSNKNLLRALQESRDKNYPTDELTNMFILLTDRYASRPEFKGYAYTWLDDMKQEALLHCLKAWNKFDPEKSDNPFAFFTSTIKHAMWQFSSKLKKHREVKEAYAVELGLSEEEYGHYDTDQTVIYDETDKNKTKKDVL